MKTKLWIHNSKLFPQRKLKTHRASLMNSFKHLKISILQIVPEQDIANTKSVQRYYMKGRDQYLSWTEVEKFSRKY